VEGPAVEKWAESIAAQHGYVNVAHTVEIFAPTPAFGARTLDW
ncbi:transcriptional repressor, partial [Streptomyces sp. NPDC006660]